MKKSLYDTLNDCKSKGLLTDDEWHQFDLLRKVLRNGFSHGDAKRIFQGETSRFVQCSFDSPEISPVVELKLENVPWLQGDAILQVAKNNALNYFVAVENFIRTSIAKHNFFGIDPNIPIITIHYP